MSQDAVENRIGLRELRQQASAVMQRVEAGEEMIVTVSGRPVAKIVPLTVGSLRIVKPARERVNWTKFRRVVGGPSSEEILADLRDDR